MKKLLTLFFLFLIYSNSRAQVSGSALVCPGFVYTYTANISGASTYTWTPPVGWQILSGQGTSQVEVLCNANDGDICADGYDGGGNFIAQNCFTTGWGGDGTGWDAEKNTIGSCICSAYSITVVANGGSSPCGGCGSGSLSPHAVYGIYNNTLPGGTFLGLADNTTPYYPDAVNVLTYYIYLIDTTAGLSNAVPITGGNCTTTINNSVQIFPCSPPTIIADLIPDPVCVGDTFTLKENSGLGIFPTYQWTCSDTDLLFVSPNGVDSIMGVVSDNSNGDPVVNFMATDVFNCPYVGQITINSVNCVAPPVANFSVSDDTICINNCVTFTNLSVDGTDFHWYFYGASIDSSLLENPASVCYPTSGQYDVKLVVSNAGGSDSITLSSVIYVLPVPAAQNIVLVNDTLFSNQGFATYQWYFNNSLISGANLYYYAATANGNYSVTSTDANGCESTFEITNIMLNTSDLKNVRFVVYPNPSSGNFVINGNSLEFSLMELVNDLGQIVCRKNLSGGENIIQTENIPAGIYQLRVYNNDSMQIMKLILTK